MIPKIDYSLRYNNNSDDDADIDLYSTFLTMKAGLKLFAKK